MHELLTGHQNWTAKQEFVGILHKNKLRIGIKQTWLLDQQEMTLLFSRRSGTQKQELFLCISFKHALYISLDPFSLVR